MYAINTNQDMEELVTIQPQLMALIDLYFSKVTRETEECVRSSHVMQY